MNELEKEIMEALYEGLTYKEIINKIDRSLSKGFIKETIKKYNPELYAIISDSKKLRKYRDEKH